MSNDLVTQNQHQVSPFGQSRSLSASVNHGAVAIEQERAIAEVQGQIIIAQRCPRSLAKAQADFLEACKSPDFASTAFYAVPNRGSGPSIRFMEEAARCFGNFQFGHRELSRTEGKSEIEVYAWDMEKNNRSTRQITVIHVTDTRNGPKILTDQADIDNKIANVASKQMRGRIAALMPKALVAAGIAACKLTIAGGNEEPISARVARMTSAFAKYGVTADHLAKYVGHPLDGITVDELADILGVYNAIKEGAKPSDYFGAADKEEAVAAAAESIKATAAAAAAAKPAAATTKAAKPAAKATEESTTAEKNSTPVKESAPATTEEAPAQAATPESADASKGDVF